MHKADAKVDRRIDAYVARTQFGQIMDRAVEKNERFVIERRGEPAVVIMRVACMPSPIPRQDR
jgi:hypothetical protein